MKTHKYCSEECREKNRYYRVGYCVGLSKGKEEQIVLEVKKLSDLIIEDGDITRSVYNYFTDVINDLKGIKCIEDLDLNIDNIEESNVKYIEAKEIDIVKGIIHASIMLKRIYFDEQE